MKTTKNQNSKKIRYAVVGLGYIAQVAMLPAFKNAAKNSELTAFFSHDPLKLKTLSKKYGVKQTLGYEDFDAYLKSGEIDAVYIALPNSEHKDFVIRAAQAGIHVLCEKPMAVTAADCIEMNDEAEKNNIKLMIAYRLHFEKVNMTSVQIAQSGKLGELRAFESFFSMQVKPGDIRLQKNLGGGTLYDIGIYCINAARYIFRAEPVEVFAFSANNGEDRFKEVDEMTSAVLKFPHERLATFTTSFGATDVSTYRVVGTRGELTVENAYEYAEPRLRCVTVKGKKKEEKFPLQDQFSPELIYFSDCILNNKQPEPSGLEGLADVRIIEALYESVKTGLPVRLEKFIGDKTPSEDQVINKPKVKKPELIHAHAPHD